MQRWLGAVALALAVLATGCDAAPVTPPPTQPIAIVPTGVPTADATSVGPTPSPSVAHVPSSAPTLLPPPYEFTSDGMVQEPGTILFGDSERGTFEPIAGWPYGIGMGFDYTYAAYWGEPLGDDHIRVTLYRVRNGTLSQVWTDVRAIDPEATGYLDSIVRFEADGVYRLEVTRGVEPIASSLIRVRRPCLAKDCGSG